MVWEWPGFSCNSYFILLSSSWCIASILLPILPGEERTGCVVLTYRLSLNHDRDVIQRQICSGQMKF